MIPTLIQRYWQERKWPELVKIFTTLWRRDNWLYLKRNGRAVKRIKERFTELFGKPPYQTEKGSRRWDEAIAKYVDRLGVAAIIRDMEAVKKQYPYITSIVWFLYSKGNACRWEMLVMDKLQGQLAEDKKKHAQEWQELGDALGFELQKVEPDWVAEARKTLESYRGRPWRDLNHDQRGTIGLILSRLTQYGFMKEQEMLTFLKEMNYHGHKEKTGSQDSRD